MEETVWHLVRDQRQSLAGALQSLPEQRWTTPSLCSQWTVRDVVAHLVMTPAREPSPWAMARALVKARGRLWTAGRDVAVAYGRRGSHELLSALTELSDARTKPVFVDERNILLDLVVHGQDIAVPLGLSHPVPDEAGRRVLDRVWAMGWPFHARRRLSGVTLRCVGTAGSDLLWTAGCGPEVSGSAGDLALLMTGRGTAVLPRLRGPGVPTLTARLPAGATSAEPGEPGPTVEDGAGRARSG